MNSDMEYRPSRQSRLQKKLIWTTLMLFISFLISTTAYLHTAIPFLYSTAITLGTTFYHFAMRLAVGAFFDTSFHNNVDYRRNWFQEKGVEPKLYQAIRVKKWKKFLPTLQPETFLLRKHSLTGLIQATCQAELVHEIIMVLSFVPVIFSVWFGSFEVFLITSGMAFLVDGSFVIVQRYNRPRLVRFMQKAATNPQAITCATERIR